MKQKEWYLNLGPLHIYPPSGYQLTDSERERAQSGGGEAIGEEQSTETALEREGAAMTDLGATYDTEGRGG